MKSIRAPICSVVGHVDHGKSSILDKIRNTSIISKEAGGITQAIGASTIPINTIKKICAKIPNFDCQAKIPGLLFIDTPGHAAFTNLRKRGGNLADVAILVIDINEGFKPQTYESIEILKTYKTPFIIAANKTDLVKGWKNKDEILVKNIQGQSTETITDLETKTYQIVGELNKYDLNGDRFDRVDDFTKQIAIVPCSAKTGEGIPELLMLITGLAQKFLELELNEGNAKGTILEVKEEKGLGTTIDVILYDGILKKNDILVIGSLNQPITTKIRALLEPNPLSEMRDTKTKFKTISEATAATGVKIAAPDIKEALAGMPIRSATNDTLEQMKQEVMEAVDEVIIETDDIGIIIKAESLGSLEAMIHLLREKDIPIKRASVGNINKRDIAEAQSNINEDPMLGVILGFNVDVENNLHPNVKIITNNIIYRLLDDFDIWQQNKRKEIELEKLKDLVFPCKIKLIPNYVFRQSNPAIVGADILAGKCKKNIDLMNEEGKTVTSVKDIQHEQKPVSEAETGKQYAISLSNVTIGRQIKEGETLYSDIPEEHFRKFKDVKDCLNPEDKELLKRIAEIKRKTNSVWGI